METEQSIRYFLPKAYFSQSVRHDWGVNVLNLGNNIYKANSLYPTGNHPGGYQFTWEDGRILDEYQLVYIASGSGIFETKELGCLAIKPGTLFLLFPGVWHRFQPDSQSGWEEYWVGFSGYYPEYLMKQECFNSRSPLIYIGFNSEFLKVFKQMIALSKDHTDARSQVLSCYTLQLLGMVYASALLKVKPQSRKEDIINNLRYQLHENWSKNLQLEELAKEQHISYHWFRKAFREVCGISPGQYLLNLRIDKAVQMLKETDMTIAEIAFHTGFTSEFHFSTMFKKKDVFRSTKIQKEF